MTSSISAEGTAGNALTDLPEWNLDDLYPGPDSVELKRDLETASADVKAFADRYRGKIVEHAGKSDGGAYLHGAIRDYEELNDRLGRIGAFATLYYVGDTTDPKRAKTYGDLTDRLNRITTDLIFFTLELNRIDEPTLETALDDPGLARYRPWLRELRKCRPHQLDDQAETLFHELEQTGAGAWNRLFDETMASLTFDVDGETLRLEPTLNLLMSPDEDRRRAAAEALAKTFRENLRIFTLVTNTLAKDKEISDRWRKFEDIADSRHLSNSVERDVVDALVSSVQAAYARLSHRYYRMKAKWLGKDKLAYWDRNAPLPYEETRMIGWDEAQRTVLEAYQDFAPALADTARLFFDKPWIDAPVRPGKAPGAFAHPTVPSAHPYVLLNYQGKQRDVMTLAHELGHGVHQVLAARQGLLLSQTPLTLAETASVFGEMLTFRKLLAQTKDPHKRKALLASKVEDMLNTVVRQIAFYTFERKVHTERREGELTADRLGEIWLEVQRESLGDAFTFGPGYETFWTYIPHFIHSPFYVYAYAFGDCLVNSLYALYEEAHEGFVEKYLAMLEAGGSKHHTELLAPFGLNAADPAFWNKGLAMIERLIDELEAVDEGTR
ncbi:M3 family oligoendopeptidase [Rhodoligotrophos defluvii]|uniref:M3 family oligoendopeptidase n=1 Tax=Rhodoligotrophos defluvii TaxID=2561934 RepID=UPI0010C98B52|nr:M3 family oligoendopeptidase [Rhodoligotrophos defluvii]